MTFKRFLFSALIITGITLWGENVHAENEKMLPEGEILIIYSDGADADSMEAVRAIAEILTYQSFKVVYAPASQCHGQLERFRNIICYKIDRYPEKLLAELYDMETRGREILDNLAEDEVTLDGIQLMFVGNEFLRQYLNATMRPGWYVDNPKTVGKLTYHFNDYTAKEVLAKEDDFTFLTGNLDYVSGKIEVDEQEGYFCATRGVLTHIPVSDMEMALIRSAFTREVALWKWPYNGEPHIYAQYMVLDKVYPFQDPDKLLQVVNELIKKEEPFVISVMPIYLNSEYPAMQHFCEILRYAQDHGGTIVIHSPINQMNNIDVDLVNEYLSMAIRNYLEQGVYPMGIQVPRNWMFNHDTIEIMARFRTVLVDREDDPNIVPSLVNNTNSVYKDGHQWIAPAVALDAHGVSYTRVNSTAIYIDITEEFEQIQTKIAACRTSYVPLKSLWDIEHSWWTDEDILTYRNHIILVNNKRVEREFVPTDYDPKFEYHRNMLQRFSKDLAAENQKLLVAVVAVSAIFLTFILIARRNNRRRFLYKDLQDDFPEDYPDE